MSARALIAAAGIGVRVEPAAAFGADAAPLADQQRAAEQVGPDLHPVVAPLVAVPGGSARARPSPRTAAAGSVPAGQRASLRRLGMESREVYHKRPIRRGKRRRPTWLSRLSDTVLGVVYHISPVPPPARDFRWRPRSGRALDRHGDSDQLLCGRVFFDMGMNTFGRPAGMGPTPSRPRRLAVDCRHARRDHSLHSRAAEPDFRPVQPAIRSCR